MSNLFERIFYDERVNAEFTAEATLETMLRFEAELAIAQGKLGIIPADVAPVIRNNCRVEKINRERLVEDSALGGNLVIPLVKQLSDLVAKESPEASRYVHYGATSQDVIDTTLMMQAKQATVIMEESLRLLVDQLARLITLHRNTLMAGRSFLQHARPISFAFKVAGWMDPLLRSLQSLRRLQEDYFVLQLGGAVGTLSAMGNAGLELSESLAGSLGLSVPARPWHSQRDRWAHIAGVLGILSGNIGKMAKDISLMAQTEIGELAEPYAKGRGGSSTMPNKSNPIGSILILANAARVPGLVSTILSSMPQDHERGTGFWHAEWQTLTDIIQLTAGMLQKAVELTGGLRVDKEKMQHNLELTRGLVYAENIALALAPLIGRLEAQDLVEECCRQVISGDQQFGDICIHHPVISRYLNPEQINELVSADKSLGLCNPFIDRVLKLKDSI